MSYRFLKGFVLLSIAILFLASCAAPSRPRSINNICSIFHEYPGWYKASKRAEKHWGTPVATQMAIMRVESNFDGEARPPKRRVLGFIPWGHISSAYGYGQALDGTWEYYKDTTHRYFASRNDFGDSADFVSWYVRQSVRGLKINPNNVYALYLSYHEGWQAYKHGSYRKYPWLKRFARDAAYQHRKYQRQLARCEASL